MKGLKMKENVSRLKWVTKYTPTLQMLKGEFFQLAKTRDQLNMQAVKSI